MDIIAAHQPGTDRAIGRGSRGAGRAAERPCGSAPSCCIISTIIRAAVIAGRWPRRGGRCASPAGLAALERRLDRGAGLRSARTGAIRRWSNWREALGEAVAGADRRGLSRLSAQRDAVPCATKRKRSLPAELLGAARPMPCRPARADRALPPMRVTSLAEESERLAVAAVDRPDASGGLGRDRGDRLAAGCAAPARRQGAGAAWQRGPAAGRHSRSSGTARTIRAAGKLPRQSGAAFLCAAADAARTPAPAMARGVRPGAGRVRAGRLAVRISRR